MRDDNLVYLYDGSFDGLLTAIFESYARKEDPAAITEESNLQVSFGQQVSRVETNPSKARRVERGLITKLGDPVYEKVWTVYLSDDPDKGSVIFRYVRHGLTIGRRVQLDLAHPDVLLMDKLYRLVGRESHLLIEFLRFTQMENGVFYAKITPEHYVVPLLMPHFSDRYCVQPFLIHDVSHGVAGVYDLTSWRLVETDGLTLPEESADELRLKRMWKKFYDTIAVQERINPKCRRNHMPKKYWKNMHEMSFAETPKTRAADQKAKILPTPIPPPELSPLHPEGGSPPPGGECK